MLRKDLDAFVPRLLRLSVFDSFFLLLSFNEDYIERQIKCRKVKETMKKKPSYTDNKMFYEQQNTRKNKSLKSRERDDGTRMNVKKITRMP